MTYSDIATILTEVGIPLTYYQFSTSNVPNPPYLVYHYPERDDVLADNQNYVKVESLSIELYTDFKDFELEARVEEVLFNHNITYSKTENYIDVEQLYQIIYEGEVIING